VYIGYEKVPGIFHCWSCGAKGAWNKLARRLGLQTVDMQQAERIPNTQDPFALLSAELDHIMKQAKKTVPVLNGLEEIPDNFVWVRKIWQNGALAPWHGFDKSFLEKYGAKYFWDKKRYIDSLYFPLKINKEYQGYTLALMDPESKLRYLTFAETKKVLFLYDFLKPGKSIVITEGHGDALRLAHMNFNAVGIFGTENWSPYKRNLLLAKRPKKVVIAFDGDRAGYDASQKLFMDLRECVDVDIAYLPPCEPKIDPGNMPNEYADWLRTKL
jgi:5S rRNA maturation endonuclease (ribonuclease M5)